MLPHLLHLLDLKETKSRKIDAIYIWMYDHNLLYLIDHILARISILEIVLCFAY